MAPQKKDAQVQESTTDAKAQESKTSSTPKPDEQKVKPPASGVSQEKVASKDDSTLGYDLLLKDIPVIDILKERSPGILALKDDITNHRRIKSSIRKELRTKKKTIEAIPRNVKKLKGENAGGTLPEEKMALTIEISLLEAQLLQVNEHLELARKRLRKLTKSESARLATQELYDKANSTLYTSRNKYFIKGSVLDCLNKILSGGDVGLKDLFTRVRQASFKLGEDGLKEFKELLAELLKAADEKTYILSSGKLKKELYEAVKLTLQLYNPKDVSIEKLTFPKDLVQDVAEFVDPLFKNKEFISSQIRGFLNENIKDENKLITLRQIAQLSKEEDTKRFFTELDDFIYEGSEDLYVLCTGDVKERLHKVILHNLQNWDQNSMFEEIQFPIENKNN